MKFRRSNVLVLTIVVILTISTIIYVKRRFKTISVTQQIRVHDDTVTQIKSNTIKSGSACSLCFGMLYPAVYSNDIPIMTSAVPQQFHIPRILHIQWKTDAIPDFAVPFMKAWRKYLPQWKIMSWTDQSMQSFVDHVYGGTKFQQFYKKLPSQIFRVDLMRYIIMYHFGGVYADLDVEPLRSLDPLLGYHSCVIAREPEPYPVTIAADTSLLASNILLISRRYHPFWTTLLSYIRVQDAKGPAVHGVGPFAVTAALEKYFNANEWTTLDSSVFLAPSLYFYPPHDKTKGDTLHMLNLRNHCASVENKKPTSSPFAQRICRVFRREKTIDWSDMYKTERYFNISFTQHHMFSSWFQPAKSIQGTTHFQDIFTTDLLTLQSLKDQFKMENNMMDPFKKNKEVLRT